MLLSLQLQIYPLLLLVKNKYVYLTNLEIKYIHVNMLIFSNMYVVALNCTLKYIFGMFEN